MLHDNFLALAGYMFTFWSLFCQNDMHFVKSFSKKAPGFVRRFQEPDRGGSGDGFR